jgi:hypothetical protein
MPHAFKASPDHPAVDYLVRLHADLGGKIWENKREAERFAEAMKHVEAVIKLFDPDFNVRRISVRRRYKGNPWFKRGTLFRHAVDALRKAKGPMTARQIAGRDTGRERRIRRRAEGHTRPRRERAGVAAKQRRESR